MENKRLDKVFKISLTILTILLSIVIVVLIIALIVDAGKKEPQVFEEGNIDYEGICDDPSIAIIEIFGGIDETSVYAYDDSLTFAQDILEQIYEVQYNDNIKGLILYIESPGGAIGSSFEIAENIYRLDKPVVAVIKNMGLSGAYLIASASDKIYASEFSEVGSIGIIQEFADTSERDKYEGINYEVIASGPFKTTGLGYTSLSMQEKAMLQEQVDHAHNRLVEIISDYRDINLNDLKKIATGWAYMGEEALDLGLIDELGGMYEAENWLYDEADIEGQYSICNLGIVWENFSYSED